jgi:hypothetical protein
LQGEKRKNKKRKIIKNKGGRKDGTKEKEGKKSYLMR